jgi:hypothetical protein
MAALLAIHFLNFSVEVEDILGGANPEDTIEHNKPTFSYKNDIESLSELIAEVWFEMDEHTFPDQEGAEGERKRTKAKDFCFADICWGILPLTDGYQLLYPANNNPDFQGPPQDIIPPPPKA